MADAFSVDPKSVTGVFYRLASLRDDTLRPSLGSIPQVFEPLVAKDLGFPEVRQAFADYLTAVRDYYDRAVTCVDDLFRVSLAAALRYEGVEADVAASMMLDPKS